MDQRFLIHFKELSLTIGASNKDILINLNNYLPTKVTTNTKVSRKTLNITSGVTCYTFDNLFKGKLYDRSALPIVADAGTTGSYPANRFNFHNCDLMSLAFSAKSPYPMHSARSKIHHPRIFTGISDGAVGNWICHWTLHLSNYFDSVGNRLQHLGFQNRLVESVHCGRSS